MWCVPKLDDEYIERMEDVLDTLAKPENPKEPVLALDERPVQLHGCERADAPMAPGRPKQRDYEYVRRGTANVFCIVEPRAGRHLTHATKNRKAPRFAAAMQRIADAYPEGTNDSRHHGQLEHASREGPDGLLGLRVRTQTLVAIHGTLHSEARPLAEPSGDRSKSVVTRMHGA